MSYRITKDFAFSAAHSLPQLPPDHKCHRLHGHNYVVRFVLEGELDQNGFVVDYAELDVVKKFIDERWDHRNLNDVLSVVTTAENLAGYLYGYFTSSFPQLVAVGVSETPKVWAYYNKQ